MPSLITTSRPNARTAGPSPEAWSRSSTGTSVRLTPSTSPDATKHPILLLNDPSALAANQRPLSARSTGSATSGSSYVSVNPPSRGSSFSRHSQVPLVSLPKTLRDVAQPPPSAGSDRLRPWSGDASRASRARFVLVLASGLVFTTKWIQYRSSSLDASA